MAAKPSPPPSFAHCVVAAAFMGLVAPDCPAQMPPPRGLEFQVNASVSGDQKAPDVAAQPDDSFVAVWESFTNNDTQRSVFFQLFDAAGNPVGGEEGAVSEAINPAFPDSAHPLVATDADGEIVIGWVGYPGTLRAKLLTADGVGIGNPFDVSNCCSSEQTPALARSPEGTFVFVWHDNTPFPGVIGTLHARLFEADGDPMGDEFMVNSDQNPRNPLNPAITFDDTGGFWVVWLNQTNIHARVFGSDGQPQASSFQVNTTTAAVSLPDVACSTGGRCMVVWADTDGTSGISSQGRGRVFTSDGAPVADDFRLNIPQFGVYNPAVAAAHTEEFVVVWQSYGSLGPDTDQSIQARLFDQDGLPLGEQVQINTLSPDAQLVPALDIGTGRTFPILWQSRYSPLTDNSGTSILGQRYHAVGLIFFDDFESGDTDEWSLTLPQ